MDSTPWQAVLRRRAAAEVMRTEGSALVSAAGARAARASRVLPG